MSNTSFKAFKSEEKALQRLVKFSLDNGYFTKDFKIKSSSFRCSTPHCKEHCKSFAIETDNFGSRVICCKECGENDLEVWESIQAYAKSSK